MTWTEISILCTPGFGHKAACEHLYAVMKSKGIKVHLISRQVHYYKGTINRVHLSASKDKLKCIPGILKRYSRITGDLATLDDWGKVIQEMMEASRPMRINQAHSMAAQIDAHPKTIP